MKTVHKSVLIWFSAQEMYALVTDVARYPEFLPWCDRAQVLEQDEAGMTAEIGLAFAGFHQAFTTRNTHVPDREVHLNLVDGPFSRLDGVWRFTPVGEPDQRACRVELDLNYGFDSVTLRSLVGPVFDKVAGTLVDAFVKRAEQVYATSP
ncbi:type II toxin-antitoxin system RatA family toxin [Variovorax sp.]|uniref:type II toxin-antitoxin system RatA family toxin n=1 Tax=Variovorax sp. TaxID=1871043 RepID=UPI002D57AEB8|nr:type II toxin-antitoxin system RatA family toxin [Variovorax sp.]HYP86151.1 type II toxin-antitoxin system RatA family toxin [Variovorax sp.]